MRLTFTGISIVLLAFTVAGCDALARKELLVRSAGENASSFQVRIEKVFDSFAARNGFACRAGDNTPVVKVCRALGPRFLELHRSSSSFSVFLDQPYPGGPMSKVPESYLAASHELEKVFNSEFGGAVVVVSK